MNDDWMDELDEIIALNAPRAAPPNSFTIDVYAERVEQKTGVRLSNSASRARLDKLVEQGKLGKTLAHVDGRERRVYWLISASRGAE